MCLMNKLALDLNGLENYRERKKRWGEPKSLSSSVMSLDWTEILQICCNSESSVLETVGWSSSSVRDVCIYDTHRQKKIKEHINLSKTMLQRNNWGQLSKFSLLYFDNILLTNNDNLTCTKTKTIFVSATYSLLAKHLNNNCSAGRSSTGVEPKLAVQSPLFISASTNNIQCMLNFDNASQQIKEYKSSVI